MAYAMTQAGVALETAETIASVTADDTEENATAWRRMAAGHRAHQQHRARVALSDMEVTANREQKKMLKAVVRKIDKAKGGVHIVHGKRGRGKSYLGRMVLHAAAARGKKFVGVGSTGVAAALLGGKNTIHSLIGVRPDNKEHTPDGFVELLTAGGAPGANLAKLDGLVTDEVFAALGSWWQALNDALQQAKGNQLLFGGVLIALCGRSRQQLPVISYRALRDFVACLVCALLLRLQIYCCDSD